MDVKIGSAPDSWGVWFPRDDKQIPWQRCLDEIAEAGYQWTELGPYGYLPTDRATLQNELSKRGLRASGTFAMGHLEDEAAWPGLEKQVLGAGESLAYLGAEYLILIDDTYTNLWTGEATAPGRLDEEAWKWLIDRIHQVVDMVADRFGLQVVFHPHAETHVEYEDQIERLLSQTDAERVLLCLDTGHHAYRGGDPIGFPSTPPPADSLSPPQERPARSAEESGRGEHSLCARGGHGPVLRAVPGSGGFPGSVPGAAGDRLPRLCHRGAGHVSRPL